MGVFPTRILLATDGSKDAALAARAASDLSKRSGSELHVAHVWQGPPGPAHDWHGKGSERSLLNELVSREVLEEQTELLAAAGATVAGAHLRRGKPAEEIARLGQEIGAGLLVVGSRGLGTIGRLVLGSVSEEVVYRASRPTLVVRGGARAWPPRRVIVGEDSSEQAKRASEAALSIAKLFGAEAILARTSYPLVEITTPVVRSAGAAEGEGRGRAYARAAAAQESPGGARPRAGGNAGAEAKRKGRGGGGPGGLPARGRRRSGRRGSPRGGRQPWARCGEKPDAGRRLEEGPEGRKRAGSRRPVARSPVRQPHAAAGFATARYRGPIGTAYASRGSHTRARPVPRPV